MTSSSARKEAGAAQAKALAAQASAGGLRFEAYLPPDLAAWMLSLIEDRIFDDPSEAVFASMQERRELEPYCDLREELRRRTVRAVVDDPSSARPLDEVMAELRARAASSADPAHWENLTAAMNCREEGASKVTEPHPVENDSERFTAGNRRRLSGPAFRTFTAITDHWRLSPEQRRRMLGNPSRSTYYRWARQAREHRSFTLSVDVLMRISAVLGIHAALSELLMTEREAYGWLRTSHQALPFRGQQPLDLVVSGTVDGILQVRRFLDGARGGLYMPPNAIDAGFEPYEDGEIVIQEASAGNTNGGRVPGRGVGTEGSAAGRTRAFEIAL